MNLFTLKKKPAAIAKQDAYYADLLPTGAMSRGGYEVTDEQVRAEIKKITASKMSNNEQYEALHLLDIVNQNHNELGMASPAALEILKAQADLGQEQE